MRRVRFCAFLTGLLLTTPLCAADSWHVIQEQAKGQTVWFNAWGGDQAVNRYLDWVSGEMKTHYAINLNIVHLADAADAVKRIQTEAAAGRKTHGSVDLLWVNGENFRTLKEANLLQTGWVIEGKKLLLYILWLNLVQIVIDVLTKPLVTIGDF